MLGPRGCEALPAQTHLRLTKRIRSRTANFEMVPTPANCATWARIVWTSTSSSGLITTMASGRSSLVTLGYPLFAASET